MNKIRKTTIRVSIIIFSLIIMNLIGAMSWCEENEKVEEVKEVKEVNLFIGDYLYFGEYHGYPIIWKVISFDNDGNPMIFSDEILDYKAFDSAESGVYKEATYESLEEIVQNLGSSRWSTSNIRDWLNSRDEKVNYTTYPPKSRALRKEEYEYYNDPGFLTHFSELENSIIVPTVHKTLLDNNYREEASGGTLDNNINTQYGTLNYGNYDNIIYENVEDKVFLLSIKEFTDLVVSQNWNYTVKQSQYSRKDGHKKDDAIWIRTSGGNPVNGMCVYADLPGNHYELYQDYTVSEDDFGIRPGLYINKDKVKVSGGEGNSKIPYSVDIITKNAETEFSDKINKNEVVEIAVKLYEKLTGEISKASTKNPYIDTANEYILKAYNIGIIDTTFGIVFEPFKKINEKEIINIFDKVLELSCGRETTLEDYLLILNKTDKENISELSEQIYDRVKSAIGGNFSVKVLNDKERILEKPLLIYNETILVPGKEFTEILGGITEGIKVKEGGEQSFSMTFNNYRGHKINIYTAPNWDKMIIQIDNEEIPWIKISNAPKVIDGNYMMPIEIFEKALARKINVNIKKKIIW